MQAELLRWGHERARAGTWHGDGRVAYLSPVADGPAPSTAFIRKCLEELRSRGFDRVVTGALAPPDQRGFVAVGFEVSEHLHLLHHDLRSVPSAHRLGPGHRLRRAVAGDREAILRVDNAAFPDFWRLDRSGLADAVAATPRARFRVATLVGDVVGYAVTGLAGRRGFVQRLAVDPHRQGTGIGSALLVDGLVWLRRWRARGAVVNTQIENGRALALYERTGFRRAPVGLSVLSLDLP